MDWIITTEKTDTRICIMSILDPKRKWEIIIMWDDKTNKFGYVCTGIHFNRKKEITFCDPDRLNPLVKENGFEDIDAFAKHYLKKDFNGYLK